MAMKMKLLFPLLLLLFSKAVWSIRPPHIEGEDIQVVRTGGVLNLTCQGSKPLKWHKDGNDLHDGTHDDYIDFTHAQQNSTDFLFVSTLTIVDVISAERGNYTCYYDDSSDLNYNKETMDSVFVFVRGDHIFVSGHLNRAKLSVGETLKIDCSITDPSYTVTLKRDDNDIINDGRLKFDPRSGFSLEDVRLEDKGEYKCESGGYTLEGRIVDITNPSGGAPPKQPDQKTELIWDIIGRESATASGFEADEVADVSAMHMRGNANASSQAADGVDEPHIITIAECVDGSPTPTTSTHHSPLAVNPPQMPPPPPQIPAYSQQQQCEAIATHYGRGIDIYERGMDAYVAHLTFLQQYLTQK